MTLLLSLACLSVTWADPPSQTPPPPPQVAPLDLVTALETVVSDAIAKAEPSVVAIHRKKGENAQETMAVRGKPRPNVRFDSPRSTSGPAWSWETAVRS
jgi:hypothetical protein